MFAKKSGYVILIASKSSTVVALRCTSCGNLQGSLRYRKSSKVVGYLIVVGNIITVCIEYAEVRAVNSVVGLSCICLRSGYDNRSMRVSAENTCNAELIFNKGSSVIYLIRATCGNSNLDLIYGKCTELVGNLVIEGYVISFSVNNYKVTNIVGGAAHLSLSSRDVESEGVNAQNTCYVYGITSERSTVIHLGCAAGSNSYRLRSYCKST